MSRCCVDLHPVSGHVFLVNEGYQPPWSDHLLSIFSTPLNYRKDLIGGSLVPKDNLSVIILNPHRFVHVCGAGDGT